MGAGVSQGWALLGQEQAGSRHGKTQLSGCLGYESDGVVVQILSCMEKQIEVCRVDTGRHKQCWQLKGDELGGEPVVTLQRGSTDWQDAEHGKYCEAQRDSLDQ